MNLLYKIAASAGNPLLASGNARTWNKEVMGGNVNAIKPPENLVRIDKQCFNDALPVY